MQPGDTIVSSVTFKEADNSYDMYIYSTQLNKGITTNYKLLAEQGKKNESVAYFVLEHQPDTCRAYPADGECTFSNIKVGVDNILVQNPQWVAAQEQPACGSKAEIVDPATIKFTWNPAMEKPQQENKGSLRLPPAPRKWNTGRKI